MSTHRVNVAVTQTQAVKKKTPSARVIAALWLLRALKTDDTGEGSTLTAGALKELAGSRVNEKKADKVVEQIYKIAAKLVQRMQLVVDKFEGKAPPPKPRKPKKTAEPAETAQGAAGGDS